MRYFIFSVWKIQVLQKADLFSYWLFLTPVKKPKRCFNYPPKSRWCFSVYVCVFVVRYSSGSCCANAHCSTSIFCWVYVVCHPYSNISGLVLGIVDKHCFKNIVWDRVQECDVINRGMSLFCSVQGGAENQKLGSFIQQKELGCSQRRVALHSCLEVNFQSRYVLPLLLIGKVLIV